MKKTVTALFPIAFVLGTTIVPGPGAQAAPTVITACQTISRSGPYVLANDIVSPGPPCLEITTGDVSIDLAGFQITSRQNAIQASTKTGSIAVRNGSIVAELGGVSLPGDGCIVEGLRIHLVTEGAAGIEAAGIVRGNNITGNGAQGQVGIAATGIVTDNHVSGMAGQGRGVGISADGTVRGNTVIDSGHGIIVGVDSTVIGNTTTNNSVSGIEADCPANLTGNTAVSNGTNLVLNGEGCHNEDNVAP